MKQRLKRKYRWLLTVLALLLLLLLLSAAFCASASELTGEEAAAELAAQQRLEEQKQLAQEYGEAVVLGVRDSLPLEGLHEGKYAGVMPQFFEELSEMTGLGFRYLSVSGDRYELAGNQQCDILSMVTEDDQTLMAHGLIAGPECFVYNGVSYRIAYTLRMPQPLIELVNNAIEQMSYQDRIQSAIAGAEQLYSKGMPAWTLWVLAALGFVCIGLIVLLILSSRMHRFKLKKAITTDELTGFLNQTGFSEKFDKLKENPSFPMYNIAYLLIDFDGQEVYAGNGEIQARLSAAGQEIARWMKPDWFAARVDQSAFLLCFAPEAPKTGEDCLLPMMDAMEEILNANEGALHAGVSAGLRCCDAALRDTDHAVHETRIAAHCAMEQKQRCLQSSPQLTRSASIDYHTARELLASIDMNAFYVYILPLLNLKTGKVVGGQALVRWKHPSRGMLMPAEFLPFIEGTDKIRQLDERVFEQVCEWVAERRQKGSRSLMISCNLSDVSLNTVDCHSRLIAMMRQYGIRRGEIGIEIDTKVLKSTAVNVKENLCRLREAGVAVILDNFGSDDTSLCALGTCDVDLVKLYSGLIPRQTGEQQLLSQRLHLLDNTITLCKRLGVMVAATGVENNMQHTVVCRLGCDLAEGYHYYRPLPCDEFDRSFRTSV